MSERHVTVATLDPVAIGQEFSRLPPHVTLAKPFSMDSGELGEYHARMEDVMEENPGGLRLLPATEENIMLFGPNNDQKVVRVHVPLFDFGIHAGAFVGSQQSDQSLSGEYMGLQWQPHISPEPNDPDCRQLLERLRWGATLSEAQLFRYMPGGIKKVIAIYALRRCQYEKTEA